jgi:hypothetical protein
VRTERATALFLIPAVTLAFVVLAGIALDLAAVHAAHRSAHRVASAAADDAAGMIDTRQVQIEGRVVVDPDAATRLAMGRVLSATLPGRTEHLRIEVRDDLVVVAFELVVGHAFLGTFPGVDDARVPVTARARVLP